MKKTANLGPEGDGTSGRPRKAAGPVQRHFVRVDPDFAEEYPEADATSTEAYANILVAGALLVAEHERRIEHTLGVNQTAAQALAVLDGAGEALTPSQIGERMIVSSASITAILDTLERRGWIRRTPNPDDRRSLLIEITDEGRATTDRFIPGLHRAEAAMLDVLTERERKQLVGVLEKVVRRANAVALQPTEPLTGIRRRPGRIG